MVSIHTPFLSKTRELMHIHELVIATCKELDIAVMGYS
jgi:hypothetical protein